MLANVAFSLRDELKQANTGVDQKTALLTAGAVIARYVEETTFSRATGEQIAPLTLVPELLLCKDVYPKLKFTVDKDRIDDAKEILGSIDTRPPSMMGMPFNQLVLCDEDTCLIVIGGGAALVCELAHELLKQIPSAAPLFAQENAPTPNGAVQ